MLSSLVTAAFMLAAPLAMAFAPPSTYDLALPAHITVAERAHKSTVVPVLVQLEPRNSARLFELALAVSTPGDDLYGKHLSRNDLAALTAPDTADVKHVADWLSPAWTDVSIDVEQGLVHASLNVGKAETLLQTSFHWLECNATGRRFVRAASYELPAHIAERGASISGLHGLPLPTRRKASLDQTSDEVTVTPTVLNTQYDITVTKEGSGYDPASSGVRQAVVEFQSQLMSENDLARFVDAYVPRTWSANASGTTIAAFHGADPGNTPSGEDPGGEAMLDVVFPAVTRTPVLTPAFD